MHVLLRHARRVMLSVAMGALFLAAAPATGRAQLVTICISPFGRKIINVNGACNPPDRAITWNVAWCDGAAWPAGTSGRAGTGGTDWAAGFSRAAGSSGTGGCDRTGGSHGSDWT